MSLRVRHLLFLVAMVMCSSQSSHASDSVPDSANPAIEWRHSVIDSMMLEYTDADREFLPSLERYLGHGLKSVQGFFGRPFPKPFTVRVFPSRTVMTAYWRAEWGIPDLETECWMVASGTGPTLSLLSPRVWKADACEHDATDTVRTQMLITHEMVHTFHGQFNPRPEFDGLDSIG